MASRNKKGKIHGIFKSAFQISFFHKPTMEGTDIYYYVVIEDLILLKMRLLYDVALVIDEVTPLTMTYLEPQYETLFSLLRDQTSVTVLVSLIGNTNAFRQVCSKYDTPIVEKEEFLDCSAPFYSKFKNYCRNDVSRYGFYLVALREDTFSTIEAAQTQTMTPEQIPPVIKEREESANETPESKQNSPNEPATEFPNWLTSFASLWEDQMHMSTKLQEWGEDYYKLSSDKDTTIILSMYMNMLRLSVSSKMQTQDKLMMVQLLLFYSEKYGDEIYVRNVSKHDVLYNLLEDSEDWDMISADTFCHKV